MSGDVMSEDEMSGDEMSPTPSQHQYLHFVKEESHRFSLQKAR